MRPFRRFLALHLFLAFSFAVFAASALQALELSYAQASVQSSSQSPAQSLAQSSPHSAPKLAAESQRDGPLAPAARELARRVAASVGAAIQGKLTFAPNCANRSSLSSFEFQKACVAFHDEIEQQSRAFRLGNSQTAEAASVSVTLAENLRDFLWIAQVTQGQSQQTFFVAVAREMVVQTGQPS